MDAVVGTEGGAGLVADVGGLVGGEDDGLGGVDAASADLFAVVEVGDVAILAEATSLTPNSMRTRWLE